MSLYPQANTVNMMEAYQQRFAVPFNAGGVNASSVPAAASPTARAAQLGLNNNNATHHNPSSPFSSSALAHDHPSYRSMIANEQREQEPQWNSLMNQQHVSRAVDVAEHNYAPEHQWFVQPNAQKGFDAFGAPQKHAFSGVQQPLLAPPALKELAMPRLEVLSITRSVSLPVMPAYLESSCFSLAKAAMKPAEMMMHVQAHLKTAGVVVAERADRKLELDCQTSMGCSEFKVCCYGGHYRECGEAKPAASVAQCYTVSFERTRGCSYAFFQLFQMLLCVLSQSGVTLESRVAAAPADGPVDAGAPGEESVDGELLDGLDLSLLQMPTLRTSSLGAEPAQMMVPTASLFDSLHDMLSSRDPNSQVSGLHALALCLDGSQPEREAQLMGEVSSMLRDAQNESVRQVAAMLISKASQLQESACTLIQTCLPSCISSLVSATPLTSNASALDVSLRQAGQKCILRACLAMVAAAPKEFNDTLMGGDAGPLRASRLKRQLLIFSAPHTEDAELRQLAIDALAAIKM